MPPAPSQRHPFIEALRDRFPELAPAVDDETVRGLLHCEVGEFARRTREAHEAGDSERVRLYFDFADRSFEGADEALLNALHVSYVEVFAWGTKHDQKARRLMPPRLASAFDRMMGWPWSFAEDGAA